MEIYTSYFARVKSLPQDVVPIAICGGIPFYWKGLWYKKVAPRIKFFQEWKQNRDNDFYIQHFNDEVLSQRDPDTVVKELFALADGADKICLICYEKPEDFCHRHLVADWLNATGRYSVKEFELPQKKEIKQDELAIG